MVGSAHPTSVQKTLESVGCALKSSEWTVLRANHLYEKLSKQPLGRPPRHSPNYLKKNLTNPHARFILTKICFEAKTYCE